MINDPVFGNITFSSAAGWQGSYSYLFLGHEVTVPLEIDGDGEDEPIDPIQRDAFERFNFRKADLCRQADDSLYAHYVERLPELREQFGDSADELMPIIAHKEDLARMITPTAFYIREPRITDARVVGFLYNCTWEPELGLAVKFVNEAVEEVGPQDIIL